MTENARREPRTGPQVQANPSSLPCHAEIGQTNVLVQSKASAWVMVQSRLVRTLVRRGSSGGQAGVRRVVSDCLPAIPLQKLNERIRDLGAEVIADAGGGPLDVLHQAVEVVAGVGDADHANRRLVPQVRGVELG